MLDSLDVGADAQRVRAQIEAVQAVRDALTTCVPTGWTGEAGRTAQASGDELAGELGAVLTTLHGLEARCVTLSVRLTVESAPGTRVL